MTFIKFGDEDEEMTVNSEQRGDQSPMEFAISRAMRFREFKLDFVLARRKILDVALERHSDEAKIRIARALLLRAGNRAGRGRNSNRPAQACKNCANSLSAKKNAPA